jgi:hypothetical protein
MSSGKSTAILVILRILRLIRSERPCGQTGAAAPREVTPRPWEDLREYAGFYLAEEIRAEALTWSMHAGFPRLAVGRAAADYGRRRACVFMNLNA